LTGVRAVAAYLVFIHHFNPFSTARFGIVSDFFHEFYVGVSIFFVLSGFLITIRYEHIEWTKKNLICYFQNRAAKIYPLYFLLTTLTFLVNYTPHSVLVYIMNITLLKGFFDSWKFTGISQGWSLTVEECFYLLAPCIFLFMKKYKVFLIQPLLFILTGFLLVKVFSTSDFYGFFESSHFMLIYTFFGRCLEFFIGIALARAYLKNHTRLFSSISFTAVGIIGLAVSIFGMAYAKDGHEFGMMTTVGLLIHHVAVPVFTALWFWGLITEKSMIRKMLEFPLSQILGKSSYAFYLIHIGIFYSWIAGYISDNSVVLFIILNVLAVGLYYFVERPLTSKIRNLKIDF